MQEYEESLDAMEAVSDDEGDADWEAPWDEPLPAAAAAGTAGGSASSAPAADEPVLVKLAAWRVRLPTGRIGYSPQKLADLTTLVNKYRLHGKNIQGLMYA